MEPDVNELREHKDVALELRILEHSLKLGPGTQASHVSTVLAVASHGGLTISEIAREVNVSLPAASRHVRRLKVAPPDDTPTGSVVLMNQHSKASPLPEISRKRPDSSLQVMLLNRITGTVRAIASGLPWLGQLYRGKNKSISTPVLRFLERQRWVAGTSA